MAQAMGHNSPGYYEWNNLTLPGGFRQGFKTGINDTTLETTPFKITTPGEIHSNFPSNGTVNLNGQTVHFQTPRYGRQHANALLDFLKFLNTQRKG